MLSSGPRAILTGKKATETALAIACGEVEARRVDIAAGGEWPQEYTGRVLPIRFSAKWRGRKTALAVDRGELAAPTPTPGLPTLSTRPSFMPAADG
jgi:hypothetical protein